jgi:hypothetical protein
MRFRRLDDKIRELCAWALASEDLAELQEIAVQLRAALQEHTNRIRNFAFGPSHPQRRAEPSLPEADGVDPVERRSA